jgi:restriction system protein
MKSYYRVILGAKSAYVQSCLDEGYVGVDYGINEDLKGKLPDEWREFNHKYIPVYLANHPGKTKIAAGLACGMLWTFAKEMPKGCMLLCPDGTGQYRLAEITGDYYHAPSQEPQHRRSVKWLNHSIEKSKLSENLQKSLAATGAVIRISKPEFIQEIEQYLDYSSQPTVVATDSSIEDPIGFAMEKHLEDFLVQNWASTDLGKNFDIFEEDGELVGQQYPSDTGPIDVLAISKDRKKLLVVELKKGKASDAVVGQTLRYMGYVQEELAEKDQEVEGVIIALEDDVRIRRALAMAPKISFFKYQVSFKLVK